MEHELVDRAVALARRLQLRAAELQTSGERRQQAELHRMLQTPSDKATLVQLTDQAFRARSPARVADQFTHILDVQGIPRFFSPLDRAMLHGFQTFGSLLPGVSVPLVKDHMQQETANVILPAEPELLAEHLRQRRAQGVRMNVNFLGEAILSEAEAERRLTLYLEALQAPETEVFSVKISTLYSQMSPLAREHTIAILCDRLERLYCSASHHTFERADGTVVPKFIYLDMEEYRDLSLTCEAFMRTLERPGLEKTHAGIALQAYVPDSYVWQQKLNAWARERVEEGGAEITVRIVKGANLEMERSEASIKGWPLAPYDRKQDTDANYKRMMQEGFRPENLRAVRLGIASHNLFDVAYGLVLAQESGAMDRVQFEMLEGMANHQRRALFEEVGNMLLYAPVCHQEHFLSAIGYLVRRLDENTGSENFLRHSFQLAPDSEEWAMLEASFRSAFARLPELSSAPRRTQNRFKEIQPVSPTAQGWQRFTNEPDTDWSLPHHAEWAQSIIERWKLRYGDHAPQVPLVIAGEKMLEQRSIRDCLDPSRPGVVVGRYRQASADDVSRAVECAAADPDGWRSLSASARKAIMQRAAQELRMARADLMGAALGNCGKTLAESDPEVSEAVDFVEFYAETARWYMEDVSPSLRSEGKGMVVVVSPWNFPIAIPCGGMAAALAAGNTVILKPASDAVLPAWELCKCFWRAGVSRKTLQFVLCSGGQEGSLLVQHPLVNAVILTGGTATAQAMLDANPDLPLSAETGGKNATIITALSDRELAIKNVLHSAFSHAGQKCSATSLLLLEAEVYDDPGFKRALVEAAESIIVGSAWNLPTRMGPLIRPPSGDLEEALLILEDGESWALRPQKLDGNDCLWTPGIKWDVAPGSRAHFTEFFGPVLGVMRYETLHEAIVLVNQTGYGLTSGLESLDDREQVEWRANVRAGNLYLNRTTVGAVVLRQPFGGMGKSALGPGLKAGGPNYVTQFMSFTETPPSTSEPLPHQSMLNRLQDALENHFSILPEQKIRLKAAFASYERAWSEEFALVHDHFHLVGQDNQRRCLPVRRMTIRMHAADTPFEIIARVAAALRAGCHIRVSIPTGFRAEAITALRQFAASWEEGIEFAEEGDDQLSDLILQSGTDRVRYAARDRVPVSVRRAATRQHVHLADAPVLMEGRIELLWYFHEQSLSYDYHRYGNLGARATDAR